MRRECQRYRIEIAAAVADELPPEVRAHVETCPGCADLRAEVTALAAASSGGPAISPEVSLSMARRALRGGGRRRTPLWIAPLLSASASAAALILYFGLAVAEPSQTSPTLQATAPPSVTEMALPDGFEASYDLLFVGTTQEDDQ